jgi:hypothetical protein
MPPIVPDELELGSVDELIRAVQIKARGKYGRHSKTAPPAPDETRQRERCKCGECYTCREEARWERIYQERFADPNYYNKRPRVFQSPLSD